MRLSSRSYRSLPPRPSDQFVFGGLELVYHAPTGMLVYAIDPAASGGGFRLRYEGAGSVTLSDDPQLLAVNLALQRWLRRISFSSVTQQRVI